MFVNEKYKVIEGTLRASTKGRKPEVASKNEVEDMKSETNVPGYRFIFEERE